jgi:hypothetical protein
MRRKLSLLVISLCSISLPAVAAPPKPHVISFGKWTSVKSDLLGTEAKSSEMKVRGLFVDTRLKELTTGSVHEVTDRLFVVQRAYRLNDSLPEESASGPRWQWQLGGWLLVDRVSGRVTAIPLSEFDTLHSHATWYRDYVAYCGVSDDGKKLSAIVIQLGRRRPILKKALGEILEHDIPGSQCSPPGWQRQPVRVTFETANGQKMTFAAHGRVVDLVEDEEEDEPSR